MSSGALNMLGYRMARRNHLYTFAWICAILLPPVMQLLAWFNDDVRDYLGPYFGPFTMYFFFVMTYGLAVIFVGYYQLSGYRKAGTLDLLRVSTMEPGEVLMGVFWQLQRMLIPPILGFAVIFVVYLALSPESRMLGELGWVTIVGAVTNVVLTQLLLCALLCLGLLRGEGVLAALCALLVLPLNILPLMLMFWAENRRQYWLGIEGGQPGRVEVFGEPMPLLLDYFTRAPWLWYVIALALVLGAVLLIARARLARLWPPQLSPLKGG